MAVAPFPEVRMKKALKLMILRTIGEVLGDEESGPLRDLAWKLLEAEILLELDPSGGA